MARTRAAKNAAELRRETIIVAPSNLRKNCSRLKTKRHAPRYRQGVTALRESRTFQSIDVDLILPKAPWTKLCNEILQARASQRHLSCDAIEALQQAAEAFLVGLFQDANRVALHVGRHTVRCEDIQLTRRLRGRDGAGATYAGLGLDGCECRK